MVSYIIKVAIYETGVWVTQSITKYWGSLTLVYLENRKTYGKNCIDHKKCIDKKGVLHLAIRSGEYLKSYVRIASRTLHRLYFTYLTSTVSVITEL
jgi:hypothetical protein